MFAEFLIAQAFPRDGNGNYQTATRDGLRLSRKNTRRILAPYGLAYGWACGNDTRRKIIR
jgi:hypothetical protein